MLTKKYGEKNIADGFYKEFEYYECEEVDARITELESQVYGLTTGIGSLTQSWLRRETQKCDEWRTKVEELEAQLKQSQDEAHKNAHARDMYRSLLPDVEIDATDWEATP